MDHFIRLSALVLTLLLTLPSTVGACTRDEAFNKMMALGRVSQGMMLEAGSDHAKQITAADFAKEVADVGQILAEEKFAEACKYYDAIAKKYSVDIDEAAKGMVTMDQIVKDGGKQGGRCSQADASKRFMEITNELNDKVALGDISPTLMRGFFDEAQTHNDLMYTNPSAYCDKLDELQKKYLN